MSSKASLISSETSSAAGHQGFVDYGVAVLQEPLRYVLLQMRLQ